VVLYGVVGVVRCIVAEFEIALAREVGFLTIMHHYAFAPTKTLINKPKRKTLRLYHCKKTVDFRTVPKKKKKKYTSDAGQQSLNKQQYNGCC
jgi:hypothetical protein